MKTNNYYVIRDPHLINGVPFEIVIHESRNWPGKIYQIPREAVIGLKNSFDLERGGLCILLGRSEEKGKDLYIGESGEMYKYLRRNICRKDFWDEALVITFKDQNLNKALLMHLKHELWRAVVRNNGYNLANRSTPVKVRLSESEKIEMREFIENLKLMVSTVERGIFEV